MLSVQLPVHRHCCFPTYRCGGSERLTDLPKVTQQRCGRALWQDWVQVAGPEPALCSHGCTASREGASSLGRHMDCPISSRHGQGPGRSGVRSTVMFATFSHSHSISVWKAHFLLFSGGAGAQGSEPLPKVSQLVGGELGLQLRAVGVKQVAEQKRGHSLEWAVSEVSFSPESKGGKATQRSEVGAGIRLDGDHGGAGFGGREGGRPPVPTLGSSWEDLVGCAFAAASVAGASSCVHVAAGNRQNSQDVRGPGHPVPHPGCPGQTQGPALWARPPSEKSERGQGKFSVPPQAQACLAGVDRPLGTREGR